MVFDELVEGLDVGGILADEKFTEWSVHGFGHGFGGGTGPESGESVVGSDFDVEGVAFVNGAYSVVEGEDNGLRHWAGEKVGLNIGDFHGGEVLCAWFFVL